ncbi:MAG: hypothetical protein IPG59_19380 [Candidatus Melainabacteria bacterium]|nr:MAG: hypothetical protein IPG59_19380 [Candidatus Melainabacteria bacterium]
MQNLIMDRSLDTPQERVEDTQAPSVNTGELTLAYSPFQQNENTSINVAFTNFMQPQNMDFSQIFGGRMNRDNFRPQYSSFRPQQPGCNQQFNQFNQSPCNRQQFNPQQFNQQQFYPQNYPQQFGPQQYRPMHHYRPNHQFNDFNGGMKFNPFDMLKMIPQVMRQFDNFDQFNQPGPGPDQFSPFRPRTQPQQNFDYPPEDNEFSPDYEQDMSQDMPPENFRPDVIERPQTNDRPQRPANSAIARLQAAVERANNGGKPLTVVQFGDSHVAANTLPDSIKAQLNKIAPTDFQAVAKGGVSSNYPVLHAQQWLDGPIKDKKPDLVIISFGSNDANGPFNDAQFRGRYQKLIDEIKQRSPNSAILVVSAADGNVKGRPLQGIDGVVNAQKDLAQKNGLMFLDLREKMGGPGSINRWREQKLASPDLLHFSPGGYRKIGEMTVDALREQAGLRNRR